MSSYFLKIIILIIINCGCERILSTLTYLLFISHPFRGIGAVVYRVPELENDQLLKISLRSLDCEDTTPISKVVGSCVYIYFFFSLNE